MWYVIIQSGIKPASPAVEALVEVEVEAALPGKSLQFLNMFKCLSLQLLRSTTVHLLAFWFLLRNHRGTLPFPCSITQSSYARDE